MPLKGRMPVSWPSKEMVCISKLFPDEIRNVAAREIQPAASESVQKLHQTPDKLVRGFHILVSVFDSCGRKRFRPMAFWSLLFFSPLPTGQCYRLAASGGEGCRFRRETFLSVIVLFSKPNVWHNIQRLWLRCWKFLANKRQGNLSLCYCTIFNAYSHDSIIFINYMTKYSKHLFYSRVLKFWPGGLLILYTTCHLMPGNLTWNRTLSRSLRFYFLEKIAACCDVMGSSQILIVCPCYAVNTSFAKPKIDAIRL